MKEVTESFTKYEVARIIGARALQIAMDAPILVKLPEEELKAINYDPLKIAELEFKAGALPITINRPMPQKRRERLAPVKEETVTDEELAAREQEVEKEIAGDSEGYGPVEEEETELETTQAEE